MSETDPRPGMFRRKVLLGSRIKLLLLEVQKGKEAVPVLGVGLKGSRILGTMVLCVSVAIGLLAISRAPIHSTLPVFPRKGKNIHGIPKEIMNLYPLL